MDDLRADSAGCAFFENIVSRGCGYHDAFVPGIAITSLLYSLEIGRLVRILRNMLLYFRLNTCADDCCYTATFIVSIIIIAKCLFFDFRSISLHVLDDLKVKIKIHAT
jgi:hypothetical protein